MRDFLPIEKSFEDFPSARDFRKAGCTCISYLPTYLPKIATQARQWTQELAKIVTDFPHFLHNPYVEKDAMQVMLLESTNDFTQFEKHSYKIISALENARCSKSEDCDEDECCLKILPFVSSKCKKFQTEGEACVQEEESNENGVYSLICPCSKGLTCKPKERDEDDGTQTMFDSKCRA
uniref:Prokineticin domain-containing protein n=1 Tax=Tetranychus urticae TaxID=32264 RepID=T1JRF3_TETUR